MRNIGKRLFIDKDKLRRFYLSDVLMQRCESEDKIIVINK